jgi:hypothetical protein
MRRKFKKLTMKIIKVKKNLLIQIDRKSNQEL